MHPGPLDNKSSALTTWPQELTWSGKSQNDLKQTAQFQHPLKCGP